ncbi:uncharacterized protein LOC135477957 [Liolophura sinensis]|uniref:uncharacterized protein LOC135477957 n=1 Tax=Liolophura sinensis TaxID=3198878 RepID=UPI0031582FFD
MFVMTRMMAGFSELGSGQRERWIPRLRILTVKRLMFVFLLVDMIFLRFYISQVSSRPHLSFTTRRSLVFLERPLPVSQETNAKKPYLDVVCVFPLMDTVEWSKARYSHVNGTELINREKEYIVSLKRNLNHSSVLSVHLFSHKPEQLYEKLTVQYGVDMKKVVFYNSTENPTYQEMFGYVSRFLQGRFIMILNADNYMGDGFVDLDLDYLRKNKVMYSLTRRFPVPMPTGCRVTNKAHCEQNSAYLGSHDSFLFFVASQLPGNFLAELNYPSHVYGSENIAIWAFKHILKFSVLNPCKKVHIHHLHCTAISAKGRIRLNVRGRYGTAKITDNIYVP